METNDGRRRRRSASAERIKNAYNGESKVEVEVIEAIDAAKPNDVPKEMKVCAYCRVSTEEESQQSSYELQVQHYTQYIQDHENWTLQGIYADEGISGTSVMHRKQFLQMIEECKEGKINLIVTKSISRFARNVLDCISYVRQLKLLNPPVGAFFEMEGINSLDPNSEMILTILSIVAQEESKQKSDSLKWSYRRRFTKGIPVNNMWAIMGYDTDEQGNIFIVEKEAEIVRFMFKAYLEGKSTSDIAEALTIAKVPTPKGKEVWQAGVVCNILHNEKYIGEMRMQKTVTVDLFTHKIKKNRGLANQYVVRNYHAPIVTRSTFEKVQQIFREGGNRRREKGEREVRVKFKPIRKGALAGFIPIPLQVEVIDIEQLKELSIKAKNQEDKKCLKDLK